MCVCVQTSTENSHNTRSDVGKCKGTFLKHNYIHCIHYIQKNKQTNTHTHTNTFFHTEQHTTTHPHTHTHTHTPTHTHVYPITLKNTLAHKQSIHTATPPCADVSQ